MPRIAGVVLAAALMLNQVALGQSSGGSAEAKHTSGRIFDRDPVGEGGLAQNSLGSSYVPIDSWIYPAFDRLIAQGWISDGYVGMRPWTRLQCASLVEEAEEHAEDTDSNSDEDVKLITELAGEFQKESRRVDGARNLGVEVESVYFRGASISGDPLRDGFHFGQTIINDYGRPYAQGLNAIAGVTAHAEAGPLAIFIQSEMQHAPAAASEPGSVLAATAVGDKTLPLANGRPELNQFRLVNAYIGFIAAGVQVSFGRQSLWLGPGNSGPFLFSNNAAPMTMLRIDSVSPFQIPLLSRVLGTASSEFFLGQLSGQNWEYSPQLFGPKLASQPFLHGTKLSFRPSASLEIGFGFTAQFGGPGNPFTCGNFLRTLYSHREATGANPGKRLSEFNFSYRVPGNWLEIYSDAMVIDEYSPIGSNRPAINPGVYFPRLPKLKRVDLRLEGITTDLNVPDHFGPGFAYWDARYRSGYTNDGNLIGSWIGRRGRAEQGWLTYHATARDSVQFGFRHTSVDRSFLQGGEIRDFSLAGKFKLANGLGLSAVVQHENWHFPLLSLDAKTAVTASGQVTFWPKHN
jgi:hypothetical protein